MHFTCISVTVLIIAQAAGGTHHPHFLLQKDLSAILSQMPQGGHEYLGLGQSTYMLAGAQLQHIIEKQKKVEVKSMDSRTKSPRRESNHVTL